MSTPSTPANDMTSPPLAQYPMLHARLITYPAHDTTIATPNDEPEGISTPWIPVSPRIAKDDPNCSEIQHLADALLCSYTNDLLSPTTPISLCISLLQESGAHASDPNVSLPSGTSEVLPQPISADVLTSSLERWISRWRIWKYSVSQHSSLLSSYPSSWPVGPVSSSLRLRAADASQPARSCHATRIPELWVNPPAAALASTLDEHERESWIQPTSDPRAILIAEDNIIHCVVLAKLLFKLGLNFKIAQDGQEAYDEYVRHPERYWCVFMDMSMPVVDGCTSARWIRRFEGENGLTACVLVMMHVGQYGHGDDGPTSSLFDYFLEKPFRLSHVRDILHAEKEKESLGDWEFRFTP